MNALVIAPGRRSGACGQACGLRKSTHKEELHHIA